MIRHGFACALLAAFAMGGPSLSAQDPGNPTTRTDPGSQDPSGGETTKAAQPSPLARLAFESGKVTVKGGLATIDLQNGWHYLQQEQARLVVEKAWGNPPDPSTLGLVTPPGFEKEEAFWAIIVSFEE